MNPETEYEQLLVFLGAPDLAGASTIIASLHAIAWSQLSQARQDELTAEAEMTGRQYDWLQEAVDAARANTIRRRAAERAANRWDFIRQPDGSIDVWNVDYGGVNVCELLNSGKPATLLYMLAGDLIGVRDSSQESKTTHQVKGE